MKIQQQQPHHNRVRGLLVLQSEDLLRQLENVNQVPLLQQLKNLLIGAKTVDEQSLAMKKLGGLTAKEAKVGGGCTTEERVLFARIILQLLLFNDEEKAEKVGSAMHLYVPLARQLELLYDDEAVQKLVRQSFQEWVVGLAALPEYGVRPWMQLSAMLASPHDHLSELVTGESLRPTLLAFFLERCESLAAQLAGDDDHAARRAGREADALLGCLRDVAPRLLRDDALDAEQRRQLAEMSRRSLFACRWTQIQCTVGGMALAVLEESEDRLAELVENVELDLGARLCLCRGICNSRGGTELVEKRIWPVAAAQLARADLGAESTSNRHFLVALLDAVGRFRLETPELVAQVAAETINHFESAVHGPLDASLSVLFRKMGELELPVDGFFAQIWNGGRAPMWGPLDHFLRAFGAGCIRPDEHHFATLLIGASGDVRMKPGAVRVFASFLSAGGSGWERPLAAALLSRNRTLHLSAAQHLIPLALKTLEPQKAVAALMHVEDGGRMLRLVLGSHLNNQKRALLSEVVDADLVRPALVSFDGWERRYALETAVAMQDMDLVTWFIQQGAKEASQSQRSASGGALCRWWKTKVGGQGNGPVEDVLAWNLYPGCPAARQSTVCAWLALKKSFASSGDCCELQMMLLELLCSRYDANRAIATTILRDQFRGKGLFVDDVERAKLTQLSSRALKCIRIRIADGGARLFTLLYEPSQLNEALSAALDMLEQHVEVGKADFSKLSSQYTLHGPLLVLKYLLDEQSSRFTPAQTKRLLAGCRAVIELCKSFVCDNTLEGHSKNVLVQYGGDEDGDDDDNGDDDDEEDALSSGSHVRVCAWRGVREACLVIGSAMQHLLGLMDEEDVSTTTDALLEIVLSSKHRGALENASIGLEQTCMACLKSAGPARLLPQQWLERVLNFDAKRMGTVRRSAGIPYAICVILRSEWVACSKRDANTPLVSFTMQRLLDGIDADGAASGAYLVMDERDVGYYRTQVHHLNILRHILRDASLSDLLRPFLEELLLLALKMWNHKEWSIRNSASLLFASAIRKLDPSTGKEMQRGLKQKKFEFRLFRGQFRRLLEHILVALERHAGQMETCGDIFSDLFPMLLLLKKLHVAEPDELSRQLCKSCLQLSAHRNQMIRHGAAKCVAALTPPAAANSEAARAVSMALDSLPGSTNRVYGLLYCALELGKSRPDVREVLKLAPGDLECFPVLCSLRCPPVALVARQVIDEWRVELPAHLQAQVAEDVAFFKGQRRVVPVALDAEQAMRKSWELPPIDENALLGVDENDSDGQDEEEDDGGEMNDQLKPLNRGEPKDLQKLVEWLNAEDALERNHGCREFHRLFPEKSVQLLRPTYALQVLMETLGTSKEFEAWAPEYLLSLLVRPVLQCASVPTAEFVENLTMKSVFEKEDTSYYHEPVLVMQLASRQLEKSVAADGKIRTRLAAAATEKSFLDEFERVVASIRDTAARTSHFDLYFWSSLFEPFFGGICAVRLLGDDAQCDRLVAQLKEIDLPHLLKKTLSGTTGWLL